MQVRRGKTQQVIQDTIGVLFEMKCTLVSITSKKYKHKPLGVAATISFLLSRVQRGTMSIFIQETHPKIRVIASVHYAFVVSIENTFCQLQSDQRILFRKTGVKWTLHDLCHGSNQHYHPVFLCQPLTNFGYESNPVPVLPLLMP